jgi:hypothetical protein
MVGDVLLAVERYRLLRAAGVDGEHGLRRASRCGARRRRFVSRTTTPARPQARGGANAAADRLVGWVRLALFREPAPEQQQQLGAPVADGKHGLQRENPLLRAPGALYPRLRARQARRRAVAMARADRKVGGGSQLASGARAALLEVSADAAYALKATLNSSHAGREGRESKVQRRYQQLTSAGVTHAGEGGHGPRRRC